MALISTPAVLLRSHDYSETSRILRLLTRDEGIVGIMAKGARSRTSKGGSSLVHFATGDLIFYFKEGRDLHTLKEFTTTRNRREIGTDVLRFGAAAVVAEIVLRHVGEASSPALFTRVEHALDDLAHCDPQAVVSVLLMHGWGLVEILGFRPQLTACVTCGASSGDGMARFDFDAGGIRCETCAEQPDAGEIGPRIGPGARAQLCDLLAGEAVPLRRPHAHLRLLSDFAVYHVTGGRPLEAVRFLAPLVRGAVADAAAPDVPVDENEDDDGSTDGTREESP